MSLARRSVTSATWNVLANAISTVVLFARSVLLARLLPVEVFGIYGLASSVVSLTMPITSFGMFGAFLHRAPETEDEEQAASTYFVLKLTFSLVWAALLIAGSWLLTTGPTRTALILLTLTTGCLHLAQVPRLILTRRVVHRRLAVVDTLNSLLTTLVAVGLAWQGVTLWALLATDLATLALTIAGFYLWRPIWRPRLSWSSPTVRYFLRFGSRGFTADVLLQALNRLDDLWTGLYLGEVALGFYSRAYAFATYPSKILATPVRTVAGGTYAELKADRVQLSRAFFRVNAFMIRCGFFLAGLLALIAPEFIRLVLGAKWMPMIDAFRLMLIFTMFDPIKLILADLFIAVGEPAKIVQARMVQLVVLIVGLFAMGPPLGIAGVALAVDIMLIAGIAILLWQARTHVQFSARRLLVVPGLCLLLGLGSASWAASLVSEAASDWQSLLVKTVVFSAVFGGLLLVAERRELLSTFSFLFSHAFSKPES